MCISLDLIRHSLLTEREFPVLIKVSNLKNKTKQKGNSLCYILTIQLLNIKRDY